MDEHFSITNKTRQTIPRSVELFSRKIKTKVFGASYDLSLVFVGDTTSRKLNKMYRKKDKPTNILSFPLSKDTGEIFINLTQAKKDAKSFGKRYNEFVVYLFIHGVLHLKGFSHGEKMEQEEEKIYQHTVES